MKELICACSEAKKDCQLVCDRWKNKQVKPDKVFYCDKWPKNKRKSNE